MIRTPVCDLMEIDHPIALGGMGSIYSPDLVAAVSNAGGLGSFFLLTEPPERYGLPAQADSPIQENVVTATVAAMGAGLVAAATAALAFAAAGKRKGRSW